MKRVNTAEQDIENSSESYDSNDDENNPKPSAQDGSIDEGMNSRKTVSVKKAKLPV